MRRDLVVALAGFYNGHPDAERFPMLAEVGRHLIDALEGGDLAAPDPVRLPVASLLDEVDLRSEVPGVGPVLRAFTAAAPILRWVQTPAYRATLSQQYLDNYGYVRIIGRSGLVESSVVSAGLGIWGAGLHYPRHEHPAEETYHVLHGAASFQRGDGPWESKSVGESVHHEPWERHAQLFGDETCVLLWAWTGEVTVDAQLIPNGE
ncbi:MAG: dimethylsulfonioproprionate lyase family protein [Actinomycetota bacterium]|nr:dimethylsulfonioproprionate lyase family protein [Actinomycetota bacterium]MED5233354.1 dimethylsulfonioproprionate lyase family protein [Actinomycetota bacterium]MED5394803.1 dimethylsulfonioproprionate lyase family protein [Actinomycetota bacterium]MEE3354312.1 dimethylsulfonioproprionate lyase family protein [Actinomycetota bacterium]